MYTLKIVFFWFHIFLPFSELSLVGLALTIVLQCYDAVGWVVEPVIVPKMIYIIYQVGH